MGGDTHRFDSAIAWYRSDADFKRHFGLVAQSNGRFIPEHDANFARKVKEGQFSAVRMTIPELYRYSVPYARS